MVPDEQKRRTDGMDGWTDGRTDGAKTISLQLCRGITNVVEVHEVMRRTKYQGSRPCGFRQEEFFHDFLT